MTKYLINKFIPNNDKIHDKSVRAKFGELSGKVGIGVNFILFAIKLVTGIFLNSVAIMADSFNNLSDAGSSIITLMGFKISSKPPDKEHPFGHGRVEYITGLIIAFVIMILGYEFFKSSFSKILNPEIVKFSYVSSTILFVTVLAKVWLSAFNKSLGNTIGSKTLLAISIDSRNDVVVTSLTLISIFFMHVTGIIIDGYVGIFVAMILLYSGFSIAKDTISSLMGESIDNELAEAVKSTVLNCDGIIGVHDLIVHNYGPGYSMASIHAEVSAETSANDAHQCVDLAEKLVLEKLGVAMVIHIDPIQIDNKQLSGLIDITNGIFKKSELQLDPHDFNLLENGKEKTFSFELLIPFDADKEKIDLTIEEIKTAVSQKYEKINCIVHIEFGFIE